jgi:hypothetical protein
MADDASREQHRRVAAWLDLLTGDGAPGTDPTGKGGGQSIYRLPVLSGSMRPDVPVGSTLGIVPARWFETRDGDLIVFRRGNALVSHRRLWAVAAGPLTAIYQKGDATPRGGWIAPGDVVGRVVQVRLPDGAVRDQTTAASRRRGLLRARRSLAADLRQRIRTLVRPGRG